ncbi:MAG: restriction endonuclease subunit S [Pseudonocardiales bacterium]|nr:MAG: restriction endonuclease subunit S [Pseudonocardiales bacterium]
MPDGWTTTQLRDVATIKGLVGGPFGSNLGTRDYTSGGIPVIRGQNLVGGRYVSFEDCVYVSQPKVAQHLSGNTACPGDLAFTQRGTLGQVAVMPAEPPIAVLSQSQMRLRIDDSAADPWFVYYCTTAPKFLKQIRDNAIIAGVPHINLGILGSLTIPTPPLEEQRRIAGVLGALDDLIDTNGRLRHLLRRAQASLYQLAIQRGFETVSLGDCAQFHNRERIPLSKAERSAMPGPFPYFGATGVVDTVGRYLFDEVHVLVGEDGSVIQDDGSPVVQMVWGKYWVNNHAHVLSGVGISDGLLRQALLASNVASLVTGAVQAKLSMGRLKTLHLHLPVDSTVSQVIDLLAAAEREFSDEVVAVASTRDELLPLLMSGRVRVSPAAGSLAG